MIKASLWENKQPHKDYQDSMLEDLSDTDIVLGMIYAYNESVCDADHNSVDPSHLKKDECRYFKYVSGPHCGGADHYNMRWVKEWCEENRPGLWKKIFALKAFW